MRRANPSPRLGWATLCVALAGCNPTPPPPAAVAPRPPITGTQTAPRDRPTVAAAPSTEPAAAGLPAFADPRVTVPYLASDELAGRLPGTPGLTAAGDYLADDLRRLGLPPPPGRPDRFQPFTLHLSTTLDPATGLLVDGKPLAVGTDFAPVAESGQGPFRGPVVFAGYAIARPANGTANGPAAYDDFAGVDVAGKVVLAMMKEPLDGHNRSRFATAGRTWSDGVYFTAKAAAAKARGATGLLLVAPPSSGGPDGVRPFFGAPDDEADAAPLPVVQVSRRVANLLLTTANQPGLAAAQAKIDAAFAPASVPLADVTVSGEVVVKRATADVRNVMAALPGAGPHAGEWVVVGAHYDHLGRGQLGHAMGPPTGLFHGADDNASGTAAVVELAAELKRAGPLPRSVLFCLFSGEEEGLLGSEYFVDHPAVPLDRVVAMLNMDMVGRLRNDDLQVGGAGTAKPFDAMVAAAVAGTGLHTSTALPDENGRGGMAPSDHMSFARHQVPVLFLFTGLHKDYHTPTDTADKINYAGIDRIVTVAGRLVTAMAAMPRPTYDATSDAGPGMVVALGASAKAAGPAKAALGVVPEMAADDGGAGVPISGVGPDTPAAAAGFRAGDRLTSFGTRPLASLHDLSAALADARPGDRVDVTVTRDGKPAVLHVTLGERKRP